MSYKFKFTVLSFLKHDFNASINVFLEALPLCIGIALASDVPIYSGFIAAIIGGTLVSLISASKLCIRGPAAGLVPVCVMTLTMLGNNLELFFAAVSLAGLMQIVLGAFKLGHFTHFIPSVVVKGMMAAIGILLIIQQIPFAIGDVDISASGSLAFFHFVSLKNVVNHSVHIWQQLSLGVTCITLVLVTFLYVWDKKLSKKLNFIPVYLIIVVIGMLMASLFKNYIPQLALAPSQIIAIPHSLLPNFNVINIPDVFINTNVWHAALLICLVASIEGLVTVDAIDKMDPMNRITPRNRELVAQGTGNLLSGLLGGLPITTLIARSTTNLESKPRTKLPSFLQGIWLLLAATVIPVFSLMIPYSVLAVIILRIGLKLARPAIFRNVYKAGKNQFHPFIVTLITVILIDMVVGVLAGIICAYYIQIKNINKRDFYLYKFKEGRIQHYTLKLSHNVSFLNKRSIIKTLDHIPDYSILEIKGSDHGNIDFDILEIINLYKSKAHSKHIELTLKNIPDLAINDHKRA